jgi:lysyl-tRNA synthetase class 2
METLRLRAVLMARIRSFFHGSDVLEVDVPVLSRFGATDPAIESLRSLYQGPGAPDGMPLFLHTSPEFFMKRLLAAGSGSIYQLSHVFRNGESGRRHNPEFMLLEWYRTGIDHWALMDEIDKLLATVLEGFVDYRPARRISYRQWFLDATGLDPWRDDVAEFRCFAEQNLASVPATMDDDTLDPWLDLLVTHWIEPQLDEQALFVHGYPPGQAALARLTTGEEVVAERFELFLNGVELANGFHELCDAEEQRRRFADDNRIRRRSGLGAVPVDEHLVAALVHGLPDSSGVALGFDRLVMLAAGLPDVASAMPFSLDRV